MLNTEKKQLYKIIKIIQNNNKKIKTALQQYKVGI